MNSSKFICLFCLLLASLFSVSLNSCKSSVTEPVISVLTPGNIAKLQAAADTLLMTTKAPGFMIYIEAEGDGEGIYITRGVSNIVTGEGMNINSSWRIGSLTKTINSEAVLILADEGKIDINKPIAYYLPELNIPNGDKITIRMLANMTSGLFNYTEDADMFLTSFWNSNGQATYTQSQLAAIAFSHPVLSEPGTKYYYCNTNYLLLGMLIQKVTGEPAVNVFNEKIFQPLGMRNTFWPLTRYLPYPYTHGYLLAGDGSIADVSNLNPSWADATGILISNFTDLRIWAREIKERKLLSDKMKAERYAWVNSDEPNISSGFGLDKIFDWVGHPGTIYGYNTEVYFNSEKKITVIIMANSIEGEPAGNILFSIMQILTPNNLGKFNKEADLHLKL